MNKVDAQALFNSLIDNEVQYDLVVQIVALATAVNELSEEVTAKRYNMLVSD